MINGHDGSNLRTMDDGTPLLRPGVCENHGASRSTIHSAPVPVPVPAGSAGPPILR